MRLKYLIVITETNSPLDINEDFPLREGQYPEYESCYGPLWVGVLCLGYSSWLDSEQRRVLAHYESEIGAMYYIGTDKKFH